MFIDHSGSVAAVHCDRAARKCQNLLAQAAGQVGGFKAEVGL